MLSRLITYVRGIVARRRVDAETDEELRFHVEHEIAGNIARGMSTTEARRVALRDLGGLTQTREAVREVRTTWIDVVRQDSILAWRRFFRARGTVAAAVLTCALGIGGTTATYSVVYGVLLRPLPVADEDSLVAVYRTDVVTANGYYSYPAFEAIHRSGAFDDVAATSPQQLDLTGDPGAERVDAMSVSSNFFRLLGTQASLGRTFVEADRDASEMPVVISDSLWRSRFGADRDVIGRTLTAVPAHAIIVGVMPPGFERAFGHVEVWLPIEGATDPAILTSPGYLIVRPIGRLANGVSLENTRSRLEAIPASDEDSLQRDGGVRLVSLRDDIVPQRIERLLVIVFVVVLLTWAVVCANLSLLFIERGASRRRELAVRLAIGASRARVVAHLLIESTWLAFVGGALGTALAVWAVGVFIASGPPALFDTNTVRVDGPVLVVSLLLTVLTAVLSGITPALRASRARTPLIARGAHGHDRAGLSHALIVSQIALTLVVLAGASLLVRSLVRIQQVDLGFDGAHVLTTALSLPPERYGEWAVGNMRYVGAQRSLLERLAAIPGVEGAAIGTPAFTPGADGRISVHLDGRRSFLNGDPEHRAQAPGVHYVGPGYMRFHGIRVVTGREFEDDDSTSTPHGVLINEAMARLYWPGEVPLGKRVNFGRRRNWTTYEEPWATVIGVVVDVRHGGVDLPVKPEVYRAQFQHPRPMFEISLRTSIPPEHVMRSVREVVRAFDPALPLLDMRTVADVAAETTAAARYSSALLSALAVGGVVLCGVGIFSLLVTSVAARRHEIAIRLALGAVPRRMVAAVLGRVVILLTVGASIGVTAALLAARTLSSLLYEVPPLDPVSHSIGVIALAIVGVAAAWIPARHAAAIDPVEALRQD